jgi:hypothetical protein
VPEHHDRAAARVDVVAFLEQDHRQIESLLDRIEQTAGDERVGLVTTLAAELRVHMAVEEEIVYPAIQRAVDRRVAEEAEAEHRLVRHALRQLVGFAPAEPGFDGALAMLQAGVQHHVEEEEDQAFALLREHLDDAAYADLGNRLAAARQHALDSDESIDVPSLEHATKAELLELARDRGLTGYSSMTKAELHAALSGS